MRSILGRTLLIAIIGLWLAGCTLPQLQPNQKPTGDELTVTDAWSRPSPMAQGNGVVYLTVTNGTGQADRLLSAESPVADHVELHETINDNGVMRMRPQPDGFEIPPHSILELKPGGKHIMLVDLTAPLVAGQSISITLHFEVAGDRQLAAPVTGMQGKETPGTDSQ